MRKLNRSIYASAARTATPTAVNFQSSPGVVPSVLHIVLDVTAIVTAPSIVLTVDALDDVSGKYYNILTSAAVTTVSTNVYRIGLGLTNSANLIVNDAIPDTLRITVTHANGNSITYSVAVNEMY